MAEMQRFGKWGRCFCFSLLIRGAAVLAGAFCCCHAAGEDFPSSVPAAHQKLTEASAGRVVFQWSKNGPRLFIFLKPVSVGYWLCRDFRSGNEYTINVASLNVLPFRSENDEAVIEMLSIWYATRLPPVPARRLYGGISRFFSSPRLDRLREFLSDFQQLQKDILTVLRQEPEKGLKKDPDERIAKVCDLILDGPPLKIIKDISQNRDYYTTALLFNYQQNWIKLYLGSREFRNSESFREMCRKLDETAGEILTNYRIDRSRGKALEQEFARLCPGRHGFRDSTAVNMRELTLDAEKALRALMKSRELSPECDFPQWGNHMLDVFAMSPDLKEQESMRAEFRKAMDAYKDFCSK